ncbi:MAG TPA: type IV pilus twitching motility protein PilT [Caldithrix abyssi]|uniref:Type IV pilus twitching motility protein PilT n=1 Tax=Caldithrix abyssi TaxID=187145 RepID=A0A7V4WVS3_CALAY|nr:type IV pilus twitching motility protein PilT [Caldithrix abyssi]
MGSLLLNTLKFAVQNNASDVHFSSGNPPVLRILGELKRVDVRSITTEELTDFATSFLNNEQKQLLKQKTEIDLSIDFPETARFRVNIYKHLNGLSMAFRTIPHKILSLEELRMPEILSKLTRRKKGLILLTGPTGSGKSTTLAAMVNEINQTRREHIITIEDPIEYIHPQKESLIHQREVNQHTKDFASALRSALREDPDVILVGEMRDLETITYALHAAETGHLVFSTMHTNSAAETVDRIINVFPSEQQQQIRTILAASLLAVIAQRLIRQAMKADRIALMEILVNTPAIQNLIREGKTHQIDSSLQTGSEYGMQTFERSLKQLKQYNLVPPEIELEDIF